MRAGSGPSGSTIGSSADSCSAASIAASSASSLIEFGDDQLLFLFGQFVRFGEGYGFDLGFFFDLDFMDAVRGRGLRVVEFQLEDRLFLKNFFRGLSFRMLEFQILNFQMLGLALEGNLGQGLRAAVLR